MADNTPNICIKVTQEDIENGVKGDPNSCPVALSIKRELPEGWEVTVGKNSFVISGHDETANYLREHLYYTEVMSFVRYFDKGKINKIKPFEFELPVFDLAKVKGYSSMQKMGNTIQKARKR